MPPTKELRGEIKHLPHVLEILRSYNVEEYFLIIRSEEEFMLQLTDTVTVGVLFELSGLCA